MPGQVPGQASSVASRVSGSTPPAADETTGKMDTTRQVPDQPLPDDPLKGAIDPLPATSETVSEPDTPGQVPDQPLPEDPLKITINPLPTTGETVKEPDTRSGPGPSFIRRLASL